MSTYTFQNVTISIEAENGKKAYSKLCDNLADNSIDWHTDTFSENDGDMRETVELFPPFKEIKKQSKATSKKELVAVLGLLLAESATVKTHYQSEFYKAKQKALKAYKGAI